MANAFAQRGYVAVSINYRLLGTAGQQCATQDPPSPACVTAALAAQHDAQAAVRWLRTNAIAYGVDPSPTPPDSRPRPRRRSTAR